MIVDAYSPFHQNTHLKFFALVIRHHDDPYLLGDNMHQTDPWTIEDGINDTYIKPFKDFVLNDISYLRV